MEFGYGQAFVRVKILGEASGITPPNGSGSVDWLARQAAHGAKSEL